MASAYRPGLPWYAAVATVVGQPRPPIAGGGVGGRGDAGGSSSFSHLLPASCAACRSCVSCATECDAPAAALPTGKESTPRPYGCAAPPAAPEPPQGGERAGWPPPAAPVPQDAAVQRAWLDAAALCGALHAVAGGGRGAVVGVTAVASASAEHAVASITAAAIALHTTSAGVGSGQKCHDTARPVFNPAQTACSTDPRLQLASLQLVFKGGPSKESQIQGGAPTRLVATGCSPTSRQLV
jgi:hypothetical protein